MSFLDMTLTAGKISLGFGWKHGSHFSRILLSKFWACWGSGCCLQRFRRVPDRPEEPQGRSWLWILVCTFVTWWLPPFCLTLLYHVHDKFAITCPTLWYHYTGRWIPSTVRQPLINFAWVGTAMPCLPSMFSVSSFITFLWNPLTVVNTKSIIVTERTKAVKTFLRLSLGVYRAEKWNDP